MPGSTIGLSMQQGYAGNVSRSYDALIEAKPVNASSGNISFGSPVFLNADESVFDPGTGSPTASNFVGIAVAEVKQGLVYGGTQTGQYKPNEMCDIIKRGDVQAVCANGTPSAGGAVYMRTVLNGAFPAEALGALRTAADGGNTIQLTNCCWKTNRKDANNITELTLKWANN